MVRRWQELKRPVRVCRGSLIFHVREHFRDGTDLRKTYRYHDRLFCRRFTTVNGECRVQSVHFHDLPRTGGRLVTRSSSPSGPTFVSTPIPNTTAYLVEGTGALDVQSGGTVSGPITVKGGGLVTVSSGDKVLSTVISSGGAQPILARQATPRSAATALRPSRPVALQATPLSTQAASRTSSGALPNGAPAHASASS
jgi:hypothetical protein